MRGTTADNGTVKKVLVNGREAKATAGNFAEWEVVLDSVKLGETQLTAQAEDIVMCSLSSKEAAESGTLFEPRPRFCSLCAHTQNQQRSPRVGRGPER